MAIQEARIERDWTCVDFAKRIGMSQAQISRLENGEQGFRSDVLQRIAKAFGVPVIVYFGADQDAKQWMAFDEVA